jgi:hypothetical protein
VAHAWKKCINGEVTVLTVVARLLFGLSAGTATAPGAVTAQDDSARLQITRAALAAYGAHRARAPQALPNNLALAFDPVILGARYDGGLRPDTTSTGRQRDAAEVKFLAGALGPDVIVPASTSNCPVSRCMVIAVAEPRVNGDSATVVLRLGNPDLIGNSRGLWGRGLTTYRARVNRIGGVWTLQCFGAVGTDAEPAPAVVESRCKPL